MALSDDGDIADLLAGDDDDDLGAAGLDLLEAGLSDDDLSGDDEAKGEVVTIVDQMKSALLNEKAAPELLPYQTELVEELKRQISLQMRKLTDVSVGEFAPLYEMELDRIKYLLASYLRVRLKKLEKYCMHVLLSKRMHNRLSPQELAFTKSYVDIRQEHLTRSMLQHLPEEYDKVLGMYREAEDKTRAVNMVREPQLDRVVFCRVTDDVGEFTMDDSPHGAPEELTEGSSWIVRYSSIVSLVHAHRVQLS